MMMTERLFGNLEYVGFDQFYYLGARGGAKAKTTWRCKGKFNISY